MINKARTLLRRLFTSKILLGILLLPFIKPPQEITGQFDLIIDTIKLFFIVFILLSYIIIRKKPSIILLAITFLQLTLFTSTLLNGGDVMWSAVQAASITGLCALFELSHDVNSEKWLSPFAAVLYLACLAVSLSMIIFYPNGVYQVSNGNYIETSNYLWGFDNFSAFSFLASFTIIAMNSGSSKKKIAATISLIAFSSFAFVYVKSLSAFICFIIFLIAYIAILLFRKIRPLMRAKYLLLIPLLLFFSLLAAGHLAPTYTLLKKVGKDGSFSSRIILWKKTIKTAGSSPVIGYGFERSETTQSKLYFDHPHNIYLDILYRSGLLGIVALTLLYLLVLKAQKNPAITYNFASLGLLCIFCCGLFDYYNYQYLIFPIFILAYYSRFSSVGPDTKNETRKNCASFSIIIPTYNSERTIVSCINSVMSQKYENYEIVVINDGSTDDTKKILKTFHDSHIRVYTTKNYGVSHARNIGINKANNEWLIFLDDDDMLSPNSLHYLSTIIADHNPDHVASPIFPGFDSYGICMYAGKDTSTIMNDYISPDYAMLHDEKRIIPLRGIGGKVYRKSLIVKNNLSFPEQYSKFEDGVFNIKYSYYSSSIIVTDKLFYEYNLNSNSVSRKKRPFELTENRTILKDIVEFLKSNELTSKSIPYLSFSMFYDSIDLHYREDKKRFAEQIKQEIDYYSPYFLGIDGKKLRLDKRLALSASLRNDINMLRILAALRRPILWVKGR